MAKSHLLLEEKQSHDFREHVVDILSAADKMKTIADDVLDMSRMEARKLQLETIPFDIRLLETIANTHSVMAQRKGIQFSCTTDTECQRLMGDPTRLGQILYNLLSNSLKFTATGRVSVRIRYHRAFDCRSTVAGATQMVGPLAVSNNQLPPHGGLLTVEVTDTGKGIPASLLAELFEPYSQIKTSIAREYGGTGLGLSIVKNIVLLMGGDVWLQSTVEVGTTITVRVPLQPENTTPAQLTPPFGLTVAAQTPETNAVPSGRPMKILVVDDEVINQKLTCRMLQGYEVAVASDGLQALKIVHDSTTPFDVILMDIQMPNMNGYDATVELRRRGFTGRIIAVTANALPADQSKCLAAGCDAVLLKPYDRGNLLAALRPLASSSPSSA